MILQTDQKNERWDFLHIFEIHPINLPKFYFPILREPTTEENQKENNLHKTRETFEWYRLPSQKQSYMAWYI